MAFISLDERGVLRMSISFTTTLNEADWDANLAGWRCPLLKIPGATVESFFTASTRVDKAWYEVLPDITVIRWVHDSQPPAAVTLAVGLTKELSTQELTVRWKQLATLLPFLTAVATALIAAAFPVLFGHPAHKSGCEMWTVSGRVKLSSGLTYRDVDMSVRPPDLVLRPDGQFSVKVPFEFDAGGKLQENPVLLLSPTRAGFQTAPVYLDPEGNTPPGVEHGYGPHFDFQLRTVAIKDMIEIPIDAGYSALTAQVPSPAGAGAVPTPPVAAATAH
jgi:hypothetical protein